MYNHPIINRAERRQRRGDRSLTGQDQGQTGGGVVGGPVHAARDEGLAIRERPNHPGMIVVMMIVLLVFAAMIRLAALTPAQVQASGALQLTMLQLNAFYAERGLVMPTARAARLKCGTAKDLCFWRAPL